MHQAEGVTPRQRPQEKEEATTATRYQLVEYESEDELVDNPMVSEPIRPFAVPIVLMSPQTGHRGGYRDLIDSCCTHCLIS